MVIMKEKPRRRNIDIIRDQRLEDRPYSFHLANAYRHLKAAPTSPTPTNNGATSESESYSPIYEHDGESPQTLSEADFFILLDVALRDFSQTGLLNEAFDTDEDNFSTLYDLYLDYEENHRLVKKKKAKNQKDALTFPLEGFLSWVDAILPYVINLGGSLSDILMDVDIHDLEKNGRLNKNAEGLLLSSLANLMAESDKDELA
jgi:hypothetical protein